jgi:hypothetical protein
MSNEKDDPYKTDRENYLRLWGTRALDTKAVPTSPVFGSDVEGGGALPDLRMVTGHFVVYPKAFAGKVSEEDQTEWARTHPHAVTEYGARVVGRIKKNREPQRAITTRSGKVIIPPVLGEERTVMSGQTAFYVAANELREKFAVFSKETMLMSDLDVETHRLATLVTIVDLPIHARPAGMTLSARDYERLDRLGERSFDVVAEFRQFVVLGMPNSEIKDFRVYSEFGEYPIEIPRDVEMGFLLRADKEIIVNDPGITRDMNTKDRAKRLVEKLRGL